MRSFVTKLGRFQYAIHNLLAHPLMEILHWFGQTELGNRVHDATLPLVHDEEHTDTLENPHGN